MALSLSLSLSTFSMVLFVLVGSGFQFRYFQLVRFGLSVAHDPPTTFLPSKSFKISLFRQD